MLTPFKLSAPSILLSLVLSSTTADAQWTPGGVPVTPTVGEFQDIAIAARQANTGVYIAWRDRRAQNHDAYLQQLTGDGLVAAGWPLAGLPVASGPTSQTAVLACPDEAGGVILGWLEFTAVGYDVRAQRIRADGSVSPGWPLAGVGVGVSAGGERADAILSDGTGGAYIAWTDDMGFSSSPDRGMLQHLGPTGVPAPGWPAEGRDLLPTPGHHGGTHLVSDGQGGVLAITAELGRAYPGTPTGRGTNHSAMRFLPDGSIAPGWPAEGLLLLRTLSATEVRKICSDGAGGAYFAWNDTRSSPQPSNPFYYRVYMQHVLGDGTIDPRWPADGLPLAPGPYGRYDFDLVGDGAGGLFAAWQEFRDDAGWRIYARRFRPDGSSAPGWPEEGLLVSSNENYEVFPKLVSDGQGGFWAMWETRWDGSTTVQRYARRDSMGQVAPGSSAEGEILAIPSFYPFPISDGNGGMYVAFNRHAENGSGRVYAQRIYGDGPTATLPSLVSAEASSGVATLRWSVSAPLPGGGRVERSSGDDMWASIGSPVEVGTRMFEYVDADLAAGCYGYRLAWIENGVERQSAATWIEVDGGLRLALAGFRPNPAVGVATLAFSLPNDRLARIEVLDVKGRVVRSRDVGELGGGSHVVSLADGAPLGAGMYWLRLGHPERTLTAKGIVVR